ncbi:hypothetical protein OCL94_12915 [Macrococcus sp. TMW 2.2395]|nr:hypothetical protein [Macrococcus sp. TMW 2.2395]
MIGLTLSIWTPLSPFPFYQQHLHVQKVNVQYKAADAYLNSLMDDSILYTTVKNHVTHRHFSVAKEKINKIDDQDKREALMNKYHNGLAVYEKKIGDQIIQQIQLENISISQYSHLTAQDYDNVRYQIQQQIQDPETKKTYLERVQKLQRNHDIEYHPVAP